MKEIVSMRAFKSFPYTQQYIKKHGKKVSENEYEVALACTFAIPVKYHHKPEELYKFCLENDVQWTDVIKLPDGVAGKDYIL